MTGAELASVERGLLDARTHRGWPSWAQHPAQASAEARRALRGLGAPLPSALRCLSLRVWELTLPVPRGMELTGEAHPTGHSDPAPAVAATGPAQGGLRVCPGRGRRGGGAAV